MPFLYVCIHMYVCIYDLFTVAQKLSSMYMYNTKPTQKFWKKG